MKHTPVKIQVNLTSEGRRSSVFVDGVDWSDRISEINLRQVGNREPEVTLTLNRVKVVGEIESTFLERGGDDD